MQPPDRADHAGRADHATSGGVLLAVWWRAPERCAARLITEDYRRLLITQDLLGSERYQRGFEGQS